MRPPAIISNDCWGGDCYRFLGQKYASPFVGLFIHGPCYLAILQDVEVALQDGLDVVTRSLYYRSPPDYPVLQLRNTGAELHMLHYTTATAARDAWRRRADRTTGPIRVKASVGKDAFTDEHIDRLLALHPSALVLGPATAVDPRIVRCADFDPATVNFSESLQEFDLLEWLAEGTIARRPTTLPKR